MSQEEGCDNNSPGTSAAAGGRELDCVIVIKKGFPSRALPSVDTQGHERAYTVATYR